MTLLSWCEFQLHEPLSGIDLNALGLPYPTYWTKTLHRTAQGQAYFLSC